MKGLIFELFAHGCLFFSHRQFYIFVSVIVLNFTHFKVHSIGMPIYRPTSWPNIFESKVLYIFMFTNAVGYYYNSLQDQQARKGIIRPVKPQIHVCV